MRSGGAELPHRNGCRKAAATFGGDGPGSQASEWELRERREREEEQEVEAEELGATGRLGAVEKLPLFLPTPSFMASAEEE